MELQECFRICATEEDSKQIIDEQFENLKFFISEEGGYELIPDDYAISIKIPGNAYRYEKMKWEDMESKYHVYPLLKEYDCRRFEEWVCETYLEYDIQGNCRRYQTMADNLMYRREERDYTAQDIFQIGDVVKFCGQRHLIYKPPVYNMMTWRNSYELIPYVISPGVTDIAETYKRASILPDGNRDDELAYYADLDNMNQRAEKYICIFSYDLPSRERQIHTFRCNEKEKVRKILKWQGLNLTVSSSLLITLHYVEYGISYCEEIRQENNRLLLCTGIIKDNILKYDEETVVYELKA